MPIRRAACAAALLCFAPLLLPAQRVLGPGDDGWTLPSGTLRIGLLPRFMVGDERFGTGGAREPLGAWLGRGSIDAISFPVLEGPQAALRDLSNVPTFNFSMGSVSADVRRQVQVIPLELALGLTRRLTLRVSAPLVAAEHQTAWRATGEGATVGLNPALTGPASLDHNTTLVNTLHGAANALDALASECTTNPTADERCDTILGELTAVHALVTSTRTFGDAVGRTYGGAAGATPAALVPMAGSTAHAGVEAILNALGTAYARYGESGLTEILGPVAAELPASITALHELLEDSTGVYALGPWDRRYQQGFGDVDIGLWWRLFDGTGADPWSRLSDSARGVRQTIGITYRLGTGTPFSPDDPLMLGTGDGQDDIEITSATDFIWGHHAWVSILGRYTKQLGDERVVRLPDPLLSPYLPLTRRVLAERTPGNRMQIEVAPRWVFNDYLASGVRYRFTHEEATQWRELAPADGANPLTASGVALTAHEVAVGVTWSSIAAWRRGRSRQPIELSWERSYVVAGSGDVFAARSDRIGALVYAKLWGR